jgi:hypothetical protein
MFLDNPDLSLLPDDCIRQIVRFCGCSGTHNLSTTGKTCHRALEVDLAHYHALKKLLNRMVPVIGRLLTLDRQRCLVLTDGDNIFWFRVNYPVHQAAHSTVTAPYFEYKSIKRLTMKTMIRNLILMGYYPKNTITNWWVHGMN